MLIREVILLYTGTVVAKMLTFGNLRRIFFLDKLIQAETVYTEGRRTASSTPLEEHFLLKVQKASARDFHRFFDVDAEKHYKLSCVKQSHC